MTVRARGFTLLELLVALVLFSLAALALARMLIVAQRARQWSENRTRAVQLASERIERIRAGDRDGAVETIGMFRRSWADRPFAPGLRRIDVTVEWREADDQQLVLSTLVRSEP